MDIVEGLNPEQLMAVRHNEGPLLVVAGAGTGKTQVITRRIALLISEGRAKPNQILALTFTEKAAREMQERLYTLVGWESFQVPVLTFNAFGAELLGRFASHIGRSIRGGLLTSSQKSLLLAQHFSEIELNYYGPQNHLNEFLDGIVGYIERLQNAGIDAKRYEQFVYDLRHNPGNLHPRDIDEQDDLARLYRLYEDIKQRSGTYDYNDQLRVPLEILQSHPNLAERLTKEYQYVLVDEYQDTNTVQDQLLRTFVKPTGNIFAVGDDDQAIYGFRGAEISNILDFAQHFEVSKPAVLVRNYRSGQAVLDAAYRLIQFNNPDRLEHKLGIDKRLVALHDDSSVSFTPYETAVDEQEGVVETIKKRIQSGQEPGTIAILAATHAPLKRLAKAMAKRDIPFALSSSASIFEQPELLALWNLLSWLKFQADDEAISHVILGSFINWDPEQLRGVLERRHAESTTLEAAIRQSDEEHCKTLGSHLDEWRGWANEVSVSGLAFRLVFDTGLAERWQHQAESSPRMIKVFEDLHRLLEHMQDFETVALSGDLGAYLAAFPTPPVLEVSEPIGDTTGVQLLTVHASKGLEFDSVFVIGVTQRNWSQGVRGSGLEVPDILKNAPVLAKDHEFRRLMYVAVTRARQDLTVSAPLFTSGGAKQLMSPFVEEMFGSNKVAQAIQATTPATPKLDKTLTSIQQFYPLSNHVRLEQKKFPFENTEGWLELGVTALASYEFCPFEFYLEQVLKVASPMGPQLVFGSALHASFEAYYRGKLVGYEVLAGELHRMLEERWDVHSYPNREAAQTDAMLAHATLDMFLEREEHLNRKILGSEVPVIFELPDAKLRLRGKIDALFEIEGGVEIRDFKTGRTKTDASKLAKSAKTNFQLRTYALAYEQLQGQMPRQVVLDYVVTMVEGAAELSPIILKNHRAKLCSLAKRIRDRDFAPNPSALHHCAATRYYGTGEQEERWEQALEGVIHGT